MTNSDTEYENTGLNVGEFVGDTLGTVGSTVGWVVGSIVGSSVPSHVNIASAFNKPKLDPHKLFTADPTRIVTHLLLLIFHEFANKYGPHCRRLTQSINPRKRAHVNDRKPYDI